MPLSHYVLHTQNQSALEHLDFSENFDASTPSSPTYTYTLLTPFAFSHMKYPLFHLKPHERKLDMNSNFTLATITPYATRGVDSASKAALFFFFYFLA